MWCARADIASGCLIRRGVGWVECAVRWRGDASGVVAWRRARGERMQRALVLERYACPGEHPTNAAHETTIDFGLGVGTCPSRTLAPSSICGSVAGGALSQCRCAASPPVSLLRSLTPSVRSVPASPWADHPVAHPPQPKSIFDKDVPPEEMIQGLLKMMPVGARTVTILPPEAVEEMSKEGKSRTRVCHVVVDAHSNGLKSRAVGLTATVGSERRVGPCPPLASTPAHPISATRA